MSTDTPSNTIQAHGQHRRKFARLSIILLLTLGMYFVQSALLEQTRAAASTDSSSDAQDQLDALAMLNEIRAQVGVPALVLSKEITQAARSHAAYYNRHERDKKVSLSAHQEKQGMEGFTGTSAMDRMKAAGWNQAGTYRSSGEVMHFKQKTSRQAMQGWLDTAYHRAIILSPKYNEVGIALVDGTAVVNLGGTRAPAPLQNGIAAYPFPGMTQAPVGFYGNEVPNPLSQLGVDYSGYIISATTIDAIDWHEASLIDEKGAAIPFYEEIYSGNTLFLYPKTILEGFHTYRVQLAYRTEGSSETQHQSWSFKTGEGHKLLSIAGSPDELVINEGEETSIRVTGFYDDSVTEPITSHVRYVSNNPAGLKPVSSSSFQGIKAANYYITAHVGNLATERVLIKVLPKLKTKTYPPLTASKPDAAVTEAEFWTMLLKQHQVDVDAYAPASKKHAADAAYQIAASRNIPLLGLTSIPARDKPITRVKIAEVLASVDGVHFTQYNAIWYVLGMGYLKGDTDSTIYGFNNEGTMTQQEAIQLLADLKPKMKSLRGRPIKPTPAELLPPLPKRESYKKPAVLKDYTLIATYHPDRTLTVEGKFTVIAGQQTTLMVQTGGKKPKAIEEVQVAIDREGNFKITSGPYTEDALNLYLRTEGAMYWISVEENAMNISEFTP
ncbi:CAP domain-containing protein [Paenibacillus terrigena]|uniref:CAP domain-containing protein n=1 Tax=Paenibacillus terrigena TaxID=369333 RepID=UPI000373AF5A|nr:CAP domain-containing protein [Paenibacillus terrigena]